MSSSIAPVLLVAAALMLLAILYSVSTSADLAGPLRSWLWRRDARRMQRSGRFPTQLERAYWSRRQYDRDARTLGALGYRVDSEQAVEPFITLPSMPTFGRANPRPRRRRVPCIYVAYSREEAPAPALR